MQSCDQPDFEHSRYRCAHAPEDGFDQCSKHRQLYIESLEAENTKLRFMIDNGLGWEDMNSDGALGEGADR